MQSPNNDADLVSLLQNSVSGAGNQQLLSSMLDSGVTVKWGNSSYYDPSSRTAYIERNSPTPATDFAHEYGHDLYRDYRWAELSAELAKGEGVANENKVLDIKMEREGYALAIEFTYGFGANTGYLAYDKMTAIYLATAQQMQQLQGVTYQQFMSMLAANIKNALRNDPFSYRAILDRARADIKNRSASQNLEPISPPPNSPYEPEYPYPPPPPEPPPSSPPPPPSSGTVIVTDPVPVPPPPPPAPAPEPEPEPDPGGTEAMGSNAFRTSGTATEDSNGKFIDSSQAPADSATLTALGFWNGLSDFDTYLEGGSRELTPPPRPLWLSMQEQTDDTAPVADVSVAAASIATMASSLINAQAATLGVPAGSDTVLQSSDPRVTLLTTPT
jgi:hypothetical protein